MLNDLIDFLFPKTSIISDERLDENNSNPYIKDEEILSLSKVTADDLDELKNKVTADLAFSIFAFREGDDFSKIIYQLKYGGMKRLGKFLGEITGRELILQFEKENLREFDLIIPVPLYKTKYRERGYNQSDLICNGINKYLELEFIPDLVKRVKYTSTQTKLNREQRIDNMKDAFELNKNYKDLIYGKSIIVVDDVVTTGSTMNEVIKVLKDNCCGKVMGCTVSMARR